MIDVNGVVVQDSGDGGDCPCRTGVVIGQKYLSGSQAEAKMMANCAVKTLKVNGQWIRYPKPPMNISRDKEWGFSRDQASRLMLGLGIAGYIGQVEDYYGQLFLNWLRHPNNDVLGLGEIANLIRLSELWWLYPLLIFLDLNMLWSTTIAWRLAPWDADNLFVMDLYYAQKKYCTPFSWLAKRVYSKQPALDRVRNNLLSQDLGLSCKEAWSSNSWMIANL